MKNNVMFKSQKKLKTVESQIRLLFVLIITIVVSDVLVAIVIEALPSMSLLTQLLVDSILLVIVVFPVLYYFTFRPLTVSITELKIAHEEILKLHRAVESSGEVIFITDRDGLITYINAEFTNLYGYTAWEVIGKTTPRILKSGMMLPENYKYFWDTLLNKDAVRSEYLNKTKDGRLITIEGSANPILNEQKEIIGFIGIQRDITKRKLAEEEIILKNKLLLEINAEKDKFFSILAHDLRGPLSAFVAVTQILTEDIRTMTLEEIMDITISMKKDASNIYRLLENLLEWSRLKRGVMEFNPVKVNLHKTIGTAIDLVSVSAQTKKIEINISVPDNLVITADNHMFETVIRNLVSNAVKFTPAGGRIGVSAYPATDNSIEIRVTDTGIGIPPEIINKLFLLNEKTSRKGTEGEPSSGLGLLLCKEFIEKHGGTIWVESEEGKGSTFCFTMG